MKLIFIIVLSFYIGACSEQLNTADSETINAITVTDFSNNEVILAKPAMRIIALAPHIVENVFSAGAGEKLVGVVTYSDFPEQATSLPIVGSYTSVNLEKIVELEPDLIITWQSNNSDETLNRIRELGFTVYVDQPKTLVDIAKSIRDIGELSGHSEFANKTADEYLKKLAVIQQTQLKAHKVTAFYQVWNSPLQTINGNHIISAAIEICGGVNIYADEFTIAPIINIESILDKNPEAIIASGMSDSRPEWLDEWLQWPSLSAVQNNNLFFVDPDHIQRHTVRILLGVATICQQLDSVRTKRSKQ